MRASILPRLAHLCPLVLALAAGCSDGGGTDTHDDAGSDDAAGDAAATTTDAAGGSDATATDGAGDAGDPCSVNGNPGVCMLVTDCAALGDHTSTPGYCAGPADIQCCTLTPNVADNPPIPAGYKLMAQADVTPEMTAWAVAILNDPVTYPMFATTTKTFGSLTVLARVEWHPPDFQNSNVHRGVTLYVPA